MDKKNRGEGGGGNFQELKKTMIILLQAAFGLTSVRRTDGRTEWLPSFAPGSLLSSWKWILCFTVVGGKKKRTKERWMNWLLLAGYSRIQKRRARAQTNFGTLDSRICRQYSDRRIRAKHGHYSEKMFSVNFTILFQKQIGCDSRMAGLLCS